MNQTLKQFKSYRNKMLQYQQQLNLLHWDLQTQTPKMGVESKLNSVSFFSSELFRLSTAEEYGRMLKELSSPHQFDALDAGMQMKVKRGLREYERFLRVPEDFYTSYVTEKARSQKAWEEAKRSSDFSVFAPHLNQIIEMTKKYVHYMEPDQDPYEVLLDTFEEGMDSSSIDRIFGQLKAGLKLLLEKISASPRPDLSLLKGNYDINSQKEVQKMLLAYIGFDFDSGCTAESEHPFTMDMAPGDIRLTNHFRQDNPIDSMFSAIHEGGHAVFAQNVDPMYNDTAVWQVDMMGLHESQSRFYENILGRNPNFWIPVYDRLGTLLPKFQSVPLELFCRAINDVHPSLIRTEADEVTYCMHIILRYDIERAIFRDQVSTDELPGLWNDKMEELLGIRPENDAQGILQDVHWSDGSFGYFPSYLLGSVYDGMFLAQMEKELGSTDSLLAQGRISEITAWLNEKIHRHGSLYTSKEVIQNVCGCGISAAPLLDYFNRKYSEIYHF